MNTCSYGSELRATVGIIHNPISEQLTTRERLIEAITSYLELCKYDYQWLRDLVWSHLAPPQAKAFAWRGASPASLWIPDHRAINHEKCTYMQTCTQTYRCRHAQRGSPQDAVTQIVIPHCHPYLHLYKWVNTASYTEVLPEIHRHIQESTQCHKEILPVLVFHRARAT